MVLECTVDNLLELKQNVLDGIIKEFYIQKHRSSSKYYIELTKYDIKASKGAGLDFRVDNANIIDEFAKKLYEGMVHNFYMYFNNDEQKNIVNRAYSNSTKHDLIPTLSPLMVAQQIVVEEPQELTPVEYISKVHNMIDEGKLNNIKILTLGKRIKGKKPIYSEVVLREVLGLVMEALDVSRNS